MRILPLSLVSSNFILGDKLVIIIVNEVIVNECEDSITNDRDPESDKLTVHSVGLDESDPDTAITLPSGAVVTLSAGGTFTYDPNHVFNSLKEDQMAMADMRLLR